MVDLQDQESVPLPSSPNGPPISGGAKCRPLHWLVSRHSRHAQSLKFLRSSSCHLLGSPRKLRESQRPVRQPTDRLPQYVDEVSCLRPSLLRRTTRRSGRLPLIPTRLCTRSLDGPLEGPKSPALCREDASRHGSRIRMARRARTKREDHSSFLRRTDTSRRMPDPPTLPRHVQEATASFFLSAQGYLMSG